MKRFFLVFCREAEKIAQEVPGAFSHREPYNMPMRMQKLFPQARVKFQGMKGNKVITTKPPKPQNIRLAFSLEDLARFGKTGHADEEAVKIAERLKGEGLGDLAGKILEKEAEKRAAIGGFLSGLGRLAGGLVRRKGFWMGLGGLTAGYGLSKLFGGTKTFAESIEKQRQRKAPPGSFAP